MLKITDLHVTIHNKKILNGINLEIAKGSIHAIMGKNGSGKSTLAHAIMGNPAYTISSGDIRLNGESILSLNPNERSQKGIFLAFQYPLEIPGVSFGNFLRLAMNAHRSKKDALSVHKFRKLLREKAALLHIDPGFMDRNLNEGFSGGEKKKAEILQLALIEPNIAILDETDSGLDIDALKVVFKGLQSIHSHYPDMAFIIVTHYNRVLDFLKPNVIHIIDEGAIVKEGGIELAEQLEQKGYNHLLTKPNAKD